MFRTPRTITAVVAAIALMVGMPGIADAAPSDPGAPPPNVTVTGSYGGWTTYEAPIGYYYGAPATVGDEVVALAGVTLGTICLGDPLPASKEMLIRQRASDGRWVTRHGPDAQTLTVEVWEVDPGTTVFDFFAANCPLLAQGLPVPEPTATGDGVVKTTTKTEEVTWYGGEGPQKGGRYKNSVRGHLEGPNGESYFFDARTKYDWDADANDFAHLFYDRMILRQQN